MHSVRPLGITALAMLYAASGLLGAGDLIYRHQKPTTWDEGVALAGWCVLAALYVVIGLGLWHLRAWARRAAIVVSGMQIVMTAGLLILMSRVTSLYLGFLVPVIGGGVQCAILIYLRTPTVRTVFTPGVEEFSS